MVVKVVIVFQSLNRFTFCKLILYIFNISLNILLILTTSTHRTDSKPINPPRKSPTSQPKKPLSNNHRKKLFDKPEVIRYTFFYKLNLLGDSQACSGESNVEYIFRVIWGAHAMRGGCLSAVRFVSIRGVKIMEYEPKNLKLWTMPSNYMGAVWPGYYVFLSQNRDSDSLTRSNFICALEAIGGESETVELVNESHWAVGWVEWIAIHQDDAKALEIADKILDKLDCYPVVNEDHWSQLEYDEACEYWERMSVRERAEYCARADISIFAARRDYMPPNDTGALMELLNGH